MKNILTIFEIIFIDLPIYLWRRFKKWYDNMQEEDIKKML